MACQGDHDTSLGYTIVLGLVEGGCASESQYLTCERTGTRQVSFVMVILVRFLVTDTNKHS